MFKPVHADSRGGHAYGATAATRMEEMRQGWAHKDDFGVVLFLEGVFADRALDLPLVSGESKGGRRRFVGVLGS